MAPLLDRMNIGGSGPVRNKAGNSGRTSTPYVRQATIACPYPQLTLPIT